MMDCKSCEVSPSITLLVISEIPFFSNITYHTHQLTKEGAVAFSYVLDNVRKWKH
jgi:hypothetical protein